MPPLKPERNVTSLEKSSRRCPLPRAPASRAWGGAPHGGGPLSKRGQLPSHGRRSPAAQRPATPPDATPPQPQQEPLISHSLPQQASAEHPKTPHPRGRNEACAVLSKGPGSRDGGQGARSTAGGGRSGEDKGASGRPPGRSLRGPKPPGRAQRTPPASRCGPGKPRVYCPLARAGLCGLDAQRA